MKGEMAMENTFFEDITIDESLEIDAGAFSATAMRSPLHIVAYGAALTLIFGILRRF